MWTFMRRNFPTLLVALPRNVRSLSRALVNLMDRRQRVMTRHRMIAVTVVGVILVGSVLERRARYLRLADYHRSQIVSAGLCLGRGPDRICREVWLDEKGSPVSSRQLAKDSWHGSQVSKYRHAARYPWLPVEPDPPPSSASTERWIKALRVTLAIDRGEVLTEERRGPDE
jgi:hypothetical protein